MVNKYENLPLAPSPEERELKSSFLRPAAEKIAEINANLDDGYQAIKRGVPFPESERIKIENKILAASGRMENDVVLKEVFEEFKPMLKTLKTPDEVSRGINLLIDQWRKRKLIQSDN